MSLTFALFTRILTGHTQNGDLASQDGPVKNVPLVVAKDITVMFTHGIQAIGL